MSHFSVVVCIDDPKRLDEVMQPWDENKQVKPYPAYEDGGPADHWLYESLLRSAEHLGAGTRILPYKPDEIGWSSASSKATPEAQRREQQADAELFRSLPDPVGWADIARLHNERYPDDRPLLVTGDGARAYTMSTYNPESKWDYWRVGGRWGGYFPYRDGARSRVLLPDRGWDSPDDIGPRHCDGGRKADLDLEALRAEKADEARERYARWKVITKGTPEALPWSAFTENISEGNGYTIDRARDEYRSQPRVQAFQAEDEFRWMDDPIAAFSVPEKLYVEREGRARAVPGYATVTLDGWWMAPGKMGWFGCSSDGEGDRIGYLEAANAYLDAVDDTVYLIALDCHI